MQEKVQIKKVSPEEVAEVRKKLPCGYGKIIADMVSGQYKPITINHMVRGYRSMKPVVYKAANKLIETINNLKNTITNENSK
ncbi:MAG: hypothetical protein WC854_13685 [Bacteroidales bacterium]